MHVAAFPRVRACKAQHARPRPVGWLLAILFLRRCSCVHTLPRPFRDARRRFKLFCHEFPSQTVPPYRARGAVRLHCHLPPQAGRWGCETALQGTRMELSRAYLVSGVDDGGAPRGGGRPTFDPRDPDHFAAAASPVLRGTPAGQRN